MKKIETTVADNMVGTIVALVAEHAAELHVTTVDTVVQMPESTRVKRQALRAPVRRIAGKRIEDHVLEWIGDRTVSRDEIKAHIKNLGYGPNSGASATSKMVDNKVLVRVGNKHYRKAEMEQAA